MKRDNRTWRFTRIIDEVNNGFDFLLIIWNSIPLLIIAFTTYKYYDLVNMRNKIILETICGKDGRKKFEIRGGNFNK